MSDSGSAIVATATGQIGVDDGDCPGRGCYLGNGGEWCSEFVSWCYQHSGHPGGLRAIPYTELMAKSPERAVEKAVRGMLPKNSLSRQQLRKLKVYAGAEHPHAAQKPVPFEITQVTQ